MGRLGIAVAFTVVAAGDAGCKVLMEALQDRSAIFQSGHNIHLKLYVERCNIKSTTRRELQRPIHGGEIHV